MDAAHVVGIVALLSIGWTITTVAALIAIYNLTGKL